ncbi:3-dehydroquinate dehydratase, type I [Planctopirus limnophila DSM 3776]|uniref:Multifunctional fusion protein n=1 Tax=Planctopirus limnophila (strain ATCC 43296 / DSM 3776 / IFAM 1008 / Mu 290) TaxID=521674 RepID=D5SYE1_PLAL2|nr:shikimate dehydrogenase [Planctopirus limnophila]ADG67669.1 3-dehydroquinate dehydratase, type I [Planctopirus limnophila DSM 3776]
MASQICVGIGRTRHQMMIAEHQALAQKGAELVELRVDYLSRTPDMKRLLADRPTPTIVTCRRVADRGRFRGTEEERQTILRTAILSGADYVDIEADIAPQIRRYGKTKRIISHHDFDQTPDDLEEKYAQMCKLDADLVKIVTMANRAEDCVRMLKLVEGAQVPTVGFCMGEKGMLTRVLCGAFGSPFTYATFNKERELAPGQFSFDEMRKMFRYEQITRKTILLGVLGDPVAHSLSPLLHNTLMRKAGFDGVYLPLRVSASELSETLDAYEQLGFTGYSATIPHKESVLQKYPMCDDFVRAIGAANTVYRDQAGHWACSNTDYQAALDAILSGLKPGESLTGKRVLLLGAGGAAKAIGMAMQKSEAITVVASRTLKRSQALADQIGGRAITWENRGSEFADILINCTPVGMHPNLNESPFPIHWLREGMLVFDTIYTPERTLLIKDARDRGCTTVTGVEMFIRQATAQFRLFTGLKLSLDDVRTIFRRLISPVRHDDLLADPSAADGNADNGQVSDS